MSKYLETCRERVDAVALVVVPRFRLGLQRRFGAHSVPVDARTLQSLSLCPGPTLSGEENTKLCHNAPFFLSPREGAVGSLVDEVRHCCIDQPLPRHAASSLSI